MTPVSPISDQDLDVIVYGDPTPDHRTEIPCNVRYSANCPTPAIAYTFWTCPTHGSLRLTTCLDHLVWAIQRRDHLVHYDACDHQHLTWIGHAEIPPR